MNTDDRQVYLKPVVTTINLRVIFHGLELAWNSVEHIQLRLIAVERYAQMEDSGDPF